MQACAAKCSHEWIGNNHVSEPLQTHETSGAVCLGSAGTVPDCNRLTSMYFLRHATCSEQGCDGQSTALTASAKALCSMQSKAGSWEELRGFILPFRAHPP